MHCLKGNLHQLGSGLGQLAVREARRRAAQGHGAVPVQPCRLVYWQQVFPEALCLQSGKQSDKQREGQEAR